MSEETQEDVVEVEVENTSTTWSHLGSDYHPASIASQTKLLKPGIYQYKENDRGWWLENSSRRFEFPYKIYGNHDAITQRIKRAWTGLQGNLGILLNGLKGTGKTVTAQLLANWIIEQGHPVLVVNHPIPLDTILQRLHQPVLVIFDEFEKTYAKPEHQQMLLSALDGMSRNAHKRLFLFATNEARIDPNFIDRPSRIRYVWEFGRLGEDVISDLLDDMLDAELVELRPSIVTYLTTRRVCSIDSAKATIAEVNIFREAPKDFEAMMNLSQREIYGFKIMFLDEKGEPTGTFVDNLSLHSNETKELQTLLSKSGRKTFRDETQARGLTKELGDRFLPLRIELLQPGDGEHDWLAHLAVPSSRTWVGKVENLNRWLDEAYCWLDKQPEGWKAPGWVGACSKNKLSDKQRSDIYAYFANNTLYGTENKQVFRIHVEATFEPTGYRTYSADAL